MSIGRRRIIADSWKRGFRVTSTRFSILFPLSLYVVCNSINIDKLIKWFRHGDALDSLALCAYLLAGLCLFIVIFALLAHRWTIKPLAILLTILSAAATYFIAKYDVAIDSSMVRNAIHTDVTEVGQLLSSADDSVRRLPDDPARARHPEDRYHVSGLQEGTCSIH